MTGRGLPTPRTTEIGRASSNSKIRDDAPSAFMIVLVRGIVSELNHERCAWTYPKNEVNPINEDPM